MLNDKWRKVREFTPGPLPSLAACREPATLSPRAAIAGPLHERARTIADKFFPRWRHDTPRPTGRDPDSSPHKGCPHHSRGQILSIGLQISFGCLTNGVAHLFFLVMKSVIAITTAQDHRAGNSRMSKFAVRPFATRRQHKTRFRQIRYQLANFSRHLP